MTSKYKRLIPRLANISTRGLVQTGDNVMIGGFILALDLPRRRFWYARSVRRCRWWGSSPTRLWNCLTATAYSGPRNHNWRDTQEADITATGLAPINDAESAIVKTLAPSLYTAIVRGANDTTGVALVEL